MWYSFSVTCDTSVVFSIQHYVIQFLSDLWQVGGFLYTTLCDTVSQWLVTRRWFSLYNIMWYSLSVTCDTSVVFSIQHYVIQFVSDLRHVGGFLYTTLCDTVCQWLATRRWFSLYNIMWYSLSVTCDTSVVFSSYYGFLHQYNFPPRYNWNIVVRGLKHHICQGKPTFTHKYVLFLNVL
jgi:neutral trehalase